MNFIHCEEAQAEKCGMHSTMRGCITRKTYDLPCACIIGNKIMHGTPIRLDEENTHWKRLWFDDGVVVKEGNPDVSIMIELKVI